MRKGEVCALHHSVSGVSYHDKGLEWTCAMAICNRVRGDKRGRVRFIFPVTLFSTKYDFQKITDVLEA